MKRSARIVVVLIVTVCIQGRVGLAQQPGIPTTAKPESIPNSHAVKIRQHLEFIGLGQDITVKLHHGNDYHGRLVATNENDFKIDEVDLRQIVTLNYEDVKRIDRGYPPKSLVGGKRRNPHTSKVIFFAALGGLAAFLIIVGSKATR